MVRSIFLILITLIASCAIFRYEPTSAFDCNYYLSRCQRNCDVFSIPTIGRGEEDYKNCLDLCQEEFVDCKTKNGQ